ncbi:kinase-like protein [Gonapodya prolifera JEL478]|uniref:Kinase-like protein n=1 Tax=Gonapodya prolifera (strain JEL478) TaxID=1344416 RepID=A0A139ASI3_GONPJ|nr:kinase-like protein [Gonapodya prolifera JEL478]|eukprot:KXS19614.1 kinase-like protein [Gonapodya prolifera JEL478]
MTKTKEHHTHTHAHSTHKQLPLGVESEVVDGRRFRWNVATHVLAHGSFASVHTAVNLHTGEEAIVKASNLVASSEEKNRNLVLYTFRELGSLAAILPGHHPNVVHLIDVAKIGETVFIFEEKVRGVELFTYLKEQGGALPYQQVRHITAQLVAALIHLHKHHVMHRDIKLDNIMIDPETLHVKIIDFNLACFFREGFPLSEPVGCINYASPQVIGASMGRSYLPERGWSDLWALGVTVYGMLCGFFPFRSEEPSRLSKEFSSLLKRRLEWFGQPVDPVARAFVERILTPASRGLITAESLARHPFIAGHEALTCHATPAAHTAADDAFDAVLTQLVDKNDGLVSPDLGTQQEAVKKFLGDVAVAGAARMRQEMGEGAPMQGQGQMQVEERVRMSADDLGVPARATSSHPDAAIGGDGDGEEAKTAAALPRARSTDSDRTLVPPVEKKRAVSKIRSFFSQRANKSGVTVAANRPKTVAVSVGM